MRVPYINVVLLSKLEPIFIVIYGMFLFIKFLTVNHLLHCLPSILQEYHHKSIYHILGGGQSTSNPIAGMHGLNISALPVNPALVAALNQVFES